jgi:hypothetical protein
MFRGRKVKAGVAGLGSESNFFWADGSRFCVTLFQVATFTLFYIDGRNDACGSGTRATTLRQNLLPHRANRHLTFSFYLVSFLAARLTVWFRCCAEVFDFTANARLKQYGAPFGYAWRRTHVLLVRRVGFYPRRDVADNQFILRWRSRYSIKLYSWRPLTGCRTNYSPRMFALHFKTSNSRERTGFTHQFLPNLKSTSSCCRYASQNQFLINSMDIFCAVFCLLSSFL